MAGFEVQNPITLRIEPQGFSLPIPYSLEKLKIGHATLNLGKIKVPSNEALATLVSLLKATRISKEMNIWAAPVSFSLNHSKLELGRLDALLADSIHICTWGSINLLTNHLEMNLGLPADTLESSFGIKNLPANYVMKIPVQGTLQNPEIVKGPAAAKIAALVAAGQIPKKGFLGGIAELISKPKQEKDIPPPARPFPWE
jgi:hypothetical protein